MARHITPFGLRMPPDLRKKVEKSARTNRRSLNAELVLRLQDSVEKDPLFTPRVSEPRDRYQLSQDETALLSAYDGLSPRRRRALLELLGGLETGNG